MKETLPRRRRPIAPDAGVGDQCPGSRMEDAQWVEAVTLTRQGVRDLNPRGVNGHKTQVCKHFFGPIRVIGRHFEYDEQYNHDVIVETFGRSCIHCDETRTV